jgi:hypothetical protein
MTAKSGYERLAQVDEYDDEDDFAINSLSRSVPNISKSVAFHPTHTHRRPSSSQHFYNEHVIPTGQHNTATAGIGGGPHRTRHRSNSAIDIKAINARLERYSSHIHVHVLVR